MTPVLVDDLVKHILTSRVYDVAIESPLPRAKKLSNQLGAEIYLKREDMQSVHSFKLRGAYNKIAQLSDHERARGVIAASAGNHAQGVALAAKKLGISALIVMPRTTPAIKIDAVKSYGAEVELAGDSYSEAADHSKVRVKETGRTYIHPFDDPLVIAGQGTIGREIIEQLPSVTHIFVPVGGGGLLAGVAAYVKALRPDVQVIGVEPEDSNAMQQSLAAGEPVTLPHVGIFADGVAVKRVGDTTFELCRKHVNEIVTVTTDQICAGIKSVFEDTRGIVEPAGALAVAGIASYNLPVNAVAVAICSGANVTFERLQQIAERTLIGSSKEALFAVTMPEQPGALLKFCKEVVNGHAITELSYRIDQRDHANVLVGVSIASLQDKQRFMQKMHTHGFEHTDLSDDDLAKTHTRHMIGGSASAAMHEQFYEVTFPERPGALADFLKNIGTTSNISLFHYRSAASDTSSVMIGFEVRDKQLLESTLHATGFEHHTLAAASLRIFIARGPVSQLGPS
jgi:threonine dehydratase